MGTEAPIESGTARGSSMQAFPSYERYQADYQAFADRVNGHAPKWLRDIRERAAVRFQEIGFPTATRGNERWKYTKRPPPLARGYLRVPHSPPAPTVSAPTT